MNINVTLQQARESVAVMSTQGDINASNFVQVVDRAQEVYENKHVKLLSPQPEMERKLRD